MAVDVELLRKTFANSPKTSTTQQPKIVQQLNEGVGEEKAGAGVFRALFDTLQRPQRAVATGVRNALDDDESTSALGGVGAGLAGKAKTSFSDVLRDHGVSGPLAAIGGFAGDVFLDPLTYVGVKNAKGLSRPEALIRAAKTPGVLTNSSVERAASVLQEADPAHLYVTFAGKKIASTNAISKPARKVKDALVGEEGNRTNLAKAFSRKSELPFGLADKARVYEASNAAQFDGHVRAIRDVFLKGTTEDERVLISHALDKGQTLSAPLLKADGHPAGFTNLGDYQELARNIFKKYFDDEVAVGLFTPDQYNPKYVHRHLRKPPPDMLPGQIKDLTLMPAGPNRAGFQQKRIKNMTLEESKQAGYEPVEDIAEILSIRSAKHYRTVGRTAFVNDAVDDFGVVLTPDNRKWLKDNGWVAADQNLGVAHAAQFKGKYLPEPIVRSLNNTEAVLRDGTIGSKAMKNYDKVLQQWKFLNTAANPGYHVRNSITDYFMNLADGVHDVSVYKQSRKVLSEVREHNTETLMNAVGSTAPIGTRSNIRLGNHTFTTGELWDMYAKSGAKSGLISAELNRNISALDNKAWADYISKATQALGDPVHTGVDAAIKFGRNIPKVIGDVSDTREDFFRMAHFIDSVKKELKTKPLDKAVEAAGTRVRKFNIDYGMLSSFEKNTARRIIPFYSFMRRNLPLQVEMLFTKPGFMALYPKGVDLQQGLLGTEDGEGEKLIPQWIRDSYPVRVAMAKQENNKFINKVMQRVAGAAPDEAVFMPTVGTMAPIGDLMNLGSSINTARREGGVEGVRELARVGVNMLTPAIKAPVELATGTSTYTGGPIKDWAGWGLSQVSQTRMIANSDQPRSWTGWLSGINVQPVTEQRQASEFRRQEDVLQQIQGAYKERYLKQAGLPVNPVTQRKIGTPETAAIKRYLDSARPRSQTT